MQELVVIHAFPRQPIFASPSISPERTSASTTSSTRSTSHSTELHPLRPCLVHLQTDMVFAHLRLPLVNPSSALMPIRLNRLAKPQIPRRTNLQHRILTTRDLQGESIRILLPRRHHPGIQHRDQLALLQLPPPLKSSVEQEQINLVLKVREAEHHEFGTGGRVVAGCVDGFGVVLVVTRDGLGAHDAEDDVV